MELGAIANSPTSRFVDLVRRAGLNPRSDFRHADLSYADLRGEDLRNFDFSQANFEGALIAGAKFNKTVKSSAIASANSEVVAQIILVGKQSSIRFGFLAKQLGSNFCVSTIKSVDEHDDKYRNFSRNFLPDADRSQSISLSDVADMARHARVNMVACHLSKFEDMELLHQIFGSIKNSISSNVICIFIVHGAKEPEKLGDFIQKAALVSLKNSMVWCNGKSLGKMSDIQVGAGSGGIDLAVGELTHLLKMCGLDLPKIFDQKWPRFRHTKSEKKVGAIRLFRIDIDGDSIGGDHVDIANCAGRRVHVFATEGDSNLGKLSTMLEDLKPVAATVTAVPAAYSLGRAAMLVAEEDSTFWKIVDDARRADLS